MSAPRPRSVRLALAAMLASIVAACGFHLQGALQLPATMSRTQLETPDPDTPFARGLRRALTGAGTALTPRSEDATAVLRVLVDDVGQRVLSVSPVGVPEEYELYHTISVSVASGGVVLLEPYEVTVTRDYRFEPTDVLGKQHEAEYLQEAMVEDLVQVVLRRLALIP